MTKDGPNRQRATALNVREGVWQNMKIDNIDKHDTGLAKVNIVCLKIVVTF